MGNPLGKCVSKDKAEIQMQTDNNNKSSINNKKSFGQSVKGSMINQGGIFKKSEPIFDELQTQMYESGMRKVMCDSERFQEKINKCIHHLITISYKVVSPIDAENHIYQIEDIQTGLFHAIKFIDQNEKQYKEQYELLESFMQTQDTHSLIRIIEYSNIKKQEISYMIMELCEDNMVNLIGKKQKFTLQEGINITMKLLSVLIDIHSSNLTHLCIEPKKILIDGFDNFKLIGIPNKESRQKGKKLMDSDEDDKRRDNTFKAPEQLEQTFEKVKQASFISNNSREEFKMTSNSLSLNQQKYGQEELKQKTDIFSMGMVILSLIGVNINEKTAGDIRQGKYSNLRDMKELNPLVYFVIHFMLQIDPIQRYSALKLQSEILIHFYKLNVNDNFQEIERIEKLIQNEDQIVDSQLNLSRYLSNDFGECSQFSVQKRNSFQIKEQISKKLAYLQFNYYLQHIQRDQSDFAKKAIILAKNIVDFKKEDLLLFEYYLTYRNCVKDEWVFSTKSRNCLEENYKKKQQIYQNQQSQQNQSNQYININQSDVIDSLSALANSMLYSYEFQSSIQYLQEVLNFRRGLYTESNHPEIAQTLSDLGDAYCQAKEYKQALQYHAQALEMRRKLSLNTNNQFVFNSLFNLSKMNFLIKEEKEARKLDQEAQQMCKAMMIKQQETQNEEQNININIKNLTEYELKKQENIKVLLQKVFPYPRINPIRAEIYENIISEYESINQYDGCLQYNTQMIDIYVSLFGENNSKSFQRIYKQGEYLKKQQKYKEALQFIQRALKIAIHLDLLSKRELQHEYESLTKLLKN